MVDLNFKYKSLLDYLKNEAPFVTDISIILGSGLGDFAEQLQIHKSISTSDIPGYPESTVIGHKGKIHFAEYENKKLILFQGRVHFSIMDQMKLMHKSGMSQIQIKNTILASVAEIIDNFEPESKSP